MTEQEQLICEIIDRIMKATPDIEQDGDSYIERTRIVRIIRGWDE